MNQFQFVSRPPMYRHDCVSCEFIGGLDDDRTFSDLYRCGETIIVRYGNKAEENYSRHVDDCEWRRARSYYTRWLVAVRVSGMACPPRH